MGELRVVRLSDSAYPDSLRTIPSPPKQLYYVGDIQLLNAAPLLTVIGSRRVSPYGRAVTNQLVHELAGQGLAVVSGLALGVDSLAHAAALEAGGKTAAVLASGLDTVSPTSHRQLAIQMLQSGGVLVSEYPPGTPPLRPNFVARNRIVSGLSRGVLIIEAAEKSSTIHTANFALEQGRAVMAVPGNITSQFSVGTNNLIKAGATPVTCANDVLQALGIEAAQRREILADTAEEAVLPELLQSGTSDASELLALSKLSVTLFNQTLTMMEITGKIRPLGAGHWALT